MSKTYMPIKPFKGYQAIDGTNHHKSLKEAKEHSRNVVVKDALNAFAADVIHAVEGIGNMPGVKHYLDPEGSVTDATSTVAAIPLSSRGSGAESLSEFLFANRDELLVALNAQVRTRKPRADAGKPRKNKTAPTEQTAA